MKELRFSRKHNGLALLDEIAAIPGVRREEDEGVGLIELGGDDFELTVGDDADEQAIAAVVAEHDPDAPSPPPPLTPVEELNAGIQAAQGMADIKAVFADWSEKYRDRL